MDSATLIHSGAAFSALVGASLVATKRDRNFELRMLGLLAILCAIAISSIALQHQGSALAGTLRLETLEILVTLSTGPLLRLYVRSGIETLSFRTKEAIHFVPASLYLAMALGGVVVPIPFGLFIVHMMTYTAWSAIDILRAPSSADGRLVWRRVIVGYIAFIHLAQIIRFVSRGNTALRDIVPLAAALGLFVLVLTGVRRVILGSVPMSTHRRSGLDADAASDLERRLERAMIDDRAFADPELTLDGLAEQVGAKSHHLSQLFNQRLATNFFEYVNGYRLEEARTRLADPENDRYTIEAVAESAGFSSRSTFYTAFRRRFGSTPAALRKRTQ